MLDAACPNTSAINIKASIVSPSSRSRCHHGHTGAPGPRKLFSTVILCSRFQYYWWFPQRLQILKPKNCLYLREPTSCSIHCTWPSISSIASKNGATESSVSISVKNSVRDRKAKGTWRVSDCDGGRPWNHGITMIFVYLCHIIPTLNYIRLQRRSQNAYDAPACPGHIPKTSLKNYRVPSDFFSVFSTWRSLKSLRWQCETVKRLS